MGVKGLLAVIDNNLPKICGPISSVQGKLVIDGMNLLHELYVQHRLDWANGGCYPKLREVTLEFFGNLLSAGVEPIVVMDGAGMESHLQDVVYRRNRSIGDIPESMQKAHSAQAGQETRHFLPVLAQATFANSVKEISEVSLVYADGKANKTVVKLANHYGCPVLGNDTNYCVFNIHGGVILYKYLTLGAGICTAYVVNRNRLFQGHIALNDMGLVFAMVAILGDGGDKSVPSLYYGRSPLKQMIDGRSGVEGGRNWPLNISQFLRSFRNLELFKREISQFRVSSNIKAQLSENCVKAETYYNITSTISLRDIRSTTSIMCSYPCDVPSPLLRQFRNGDLPSFLMNAIALGKTCLSQQVGDKRQPPVVDLGRPIRLAAYGFASGLMNRHASQGITEFHRNAANAQHELSYSGHGVSPNCPNRELMVTNIAQLSEDRRIPLAKRAICAILECSMESISEFDNDAERPWMLVVALTRFWAQKLLQRNVRNADRIIRALVFSFIKCSSRVAEDSDREEPEGPFPDTFGDPNWIRVYHAAVEWQCLYADTCGLNAILMQPFEVPSPASLYDGGAVLLYAVHEGVSTEIQRLPSRKRMLYDKLLTAVMS